MKEIEVLIPHRKPFLFLDELMVFTKEEIVGMATFSDTNDFLTGSFPEFNYVPGVVLIEAMAQCGGAGIKKLGLASGYFALANIESASFAGGVPYNKIFKMVIRNIKVSSKFLKQSGVGYVDDKACVEVTWTCIKFGE